VSTSGGFIPEPQSGALSLDPTGGFVPRKLSSSTDNFWRLHPQTPIRGSASGPPMGDLSPTSVLTDKFWICLCLVGPTVLILYHKQKPGSWTWPYRVSLPQLNDLYVESEPSQLYVQHVGHVGGLRVKSRGIAQFPELWDDLMFTFHHFITRRGRLIQLSVDECNHCINTKQLLLLLLVVVWHCSSAVVWINKVNLRRARLVLGWATMSGFHYRCRTFILVCNQPPRPTQPSILLGSVNENQLRLRRKREIWFIPLADERGVCR